MALLKEDGSLDVERINNLPYEEYTRVISELTQKQLKEYSSKLPLIESYEPMESIKVSYTMEEDVARNGLINADEMFDRIRKKYGM